MDQQQFESYIAHALDTLPEEFAKRLDNVDVVSELWPTPMDLRDGRVPISGTLLGLYRGIPQTKRTNYNAALPDRIIIFMGPMIALYGDDPEKIKSQVYKTLIHEIGHHFGLSEEEIRKAENKR